VEKPQPPDLLDVLAAMPSQDGYTPMDCYRDFRKVFGTDEGQRVLREILSWGRMFRAPVLGNPIDPYAMAVAFGERNIALKLLATIHNEPKDKPQRARKKV
jgi:hypothetical protein